MGRMHLYGNVKVVLLYSSHLYVSRINNANLRTVPNVRQSLVNNHVKKFSYSSSPIHELDKIPVPLSLIFGSKFALCFQLPFFLVVSICIKSVVFFRV